MNKFYKKIGSFLKKFLCKKECILLVVVILWASFGFLAYDALPVDVFQKYNGNNRNPKVYIDYLNVFYVAASALFTGLAFAITFCSLDTQQKELKEQKEQLQKENLYLSQQISLGVFTNAFRHVLDNEKFREAKKYLYSNSFDKDVDILVSNRCGKIQQAIDDNATNYKKLNEETNTTIFSQLEKQYQENLERIRKNDDYKIVLKELTIENFREIKTPILINGKVSYTNASYERIKYVCDRMEYLGKIQFTYFNKNNSENELTDKYLIVDYFGSDIIKSYEKLQSFIANMQEGKTGNQYFNFTYLYNCAVIRKEGYIASMQKILKEQTDKIES